MKKLFDLCVVTKSYTQNGDKKNNYENIGSLYEHEGRKFITLKAHFNPAAITRKEGSDSIFVSMFAPKDKQVNSKGSGSSQKQDNSEQDLGFDNEDYKNDKGFPF